MRCKLSRKGELFLSEGSLFLSESSPSQAHIRSPAPPKWEPLAVHANCIFMPRPLPLGEVSPQVTERARTLKIKPSQSKPYGFASSPPRGSWRAAPERVYPAGQKSMVLRLFCKLFVNPIDKAGGQEYIFSSRADRVLKTKRTAPQEVCKTMKKNIDTVESRLCRRRARSC